MQLSTLQQTKDLTLLLNMAKLLLRLKLTLWLKMLEDRQLGTIQVDY
jgi:hypothetical protein